MSSYATIRYEVSDGVATLSLHRPERRNAITNQMVREVAQALAAAKEDATIRVLVLTGSGSTFCPGADINWVAGGSGATDGGSAEDQRLTTAEFVIPALLREMPAITVAAINGACAGAALGWVCGCDLRIAAASARFNTAFLDVGVAGDMGLPWSLPRLLGASKALQLMLLPDKFDAAEALRIGLVAAVHADEEFAAATRALVERLMAVNPPALRTLKRNVLDASTMSFPELLEVEAQRHIGLFALADTREAFAARAEKRAPRFTGN